MTDFIVGLIIVAIIAAAGLYIYKEKKRGVKCIGCPSAGTCASQGKSGGCSCNCGDTSETI